MSYHEVPLHATHLDVVVDEVDNVGPAVGFLEGPLDLLGEVELVRVGSVALAAALLGAGTGQTHAVNTVIQRVVVVEFLRIGQGLNFSMCSKN